jgi:hypothetical protein
VLELLLVFIAIAIMFVLQGQSRPSEPPRFVHWREWVGRDPVEPIDHYYQIIEADNWHLILREVGYRWVPDGNGSYRNEPVPHAFVPQSRPERKLFFYDGSNNPPTIPMPNGPMRCRLL